MEPLHPTAHRARENARHGGRRGWIEATATGSRLVAILTETVDPDGHVVTERLERPADREGRQ